ncbi:transcription-repair-coupling factor [Spirochaetia bacterium]|nr:transcription-repair-coupling factor [Spirochaetia bacterium]
MFSIQNEISKSAALEELKTKFINDDFPITIEGAQGSFYSLVIAALYKKKERPMLIVVPSEKEAADLACDLALLNINAPVFPWWGTIPYRDTPNASPVFGERASVLCAISGGEDAPIVIAGMRAFLTPLPPSEYIKSLLIKIKTGDILDIQKLNASLTFWSYTRVQKVQMPGEYVLRGEVIDIYLSNESSAYRITLDFDKVESIKRFLVDDQSGGELVSEISIHPLKEVVWDDERIDMLSNNIVKFNEFKDGGKEIIEHLIQHNTCAGEELFFPLAFKKSASLLDYFNGGTVVFIERERIENAQSVLEKEYQNLFNSALQEKDVPSPDRILLNFKTLAGTIKNTISFLSIKNEKANFVFKCEPARSFAGNINYMKEEFSSLLQNGWRIIIAAESDIQKERISGILKDLPEVQVIVAPVSSGFALNEIKLLLVEEKEIFGRMAKPPRSLKTARSAAIDSFVDLNPGDYVVHINYGIGLFKGIDRIKALGHERDYIQLEYANEEIVFVPIEQVNLVQRYIGNEGAPPHLDILGSKSWNERKARAKKAAEELAVHLIDIYSKREASVGFAFPVDTEWQTMFEASFPYEETEDQLRCVEEIKADMEKSRPMDRLVAGDVGYGKTEVALRACFKAVMGGKQTAFLAPTTILVEQHYETFKDRFKNFPVRIAMLSRFVDRKVIRRTIEGVQKGEVDILVGTHRILQKDIIFKDLGLLVIDEEQRFGVKDKERLKSLKLNVDCLALSATPIPRTLHMSLLKIRDMSILATPPQNRRAIETSVCEYDDNKAAEAIRKEALRGGQIFFLHNRIESLEETRIRLQQLVPEMLIETAHGRMDPEDLEDVMRRFISGGFHVLVSTTIVENGIDIPNVNTIIIDRADMYGVSQLYQLRGRVGRSDRTAYAYLFYPRDRALSELSMRRLQVISDFTELGSGFKIAMKDMEIRGAGNLLGREQSGAIYSVGFDLYVRLLDEAIQKLKTANYEAEMETLLELEYTGFIPNSYIDSAQEKMEIYKKIAAVKTREELESLHYEIEDRFGKPPHEALSLLSLAEIRIICNELSISSLKERSGVVRTEFKKVSKINVERLINLMKEGGGKIKLDPHAPNVLLLKTGNIGLKEKSEFIKEKLKYLM